MSGVKKFVKKTVVNPIHKVLEATNVVNKADPPPPPTTPQPVTTPQPAVTQTGLPPSLPLPPKSLSMEDIKSLLEPPPATPTPGSPAYANLRREKLAKFAAGNAGRAATILSRRSRRSRSNTQSSLEDAPSGAASYSNDLLGK